MPYNQQGALPLQAASGQEYGKAGQQIEAQRQVPMAPPPQGDGQGQMGPGASIAGGFGGLTDPSERTEEPVTAGAPLGPGPGPEVLGYTPTRRGEELIRLAADETGDPFLQGLIDRMSR